ncbi:MAG TPA: hypothetical protein VN706_25125 [Gemmatimonadaceae bacterium]|nr:hypothetical protein [Gemmatimonadaceae bacterium]
MPDLVIRIKKKTDGSAALSCTRADGSVTWQRQEGSQGRFFPLHDLTHFAVESTLGFRRAFYGLVAEGWDIGSFEANGVAAIPDEALLAELIVGFLDVERASGQRDSAEDFNWKIDTYCNEHGLPPTTFRMTAERLDAIRRRRAALFDRWSAVPAGEALELTFDRTGDTNAAVGA